MDFTSIKTGLEGFVERYDSQTFIGSYRETTRSSLLNDGLSTRANSLWKMAEYVVARYDKSNTPMISYINGWKQLASGTGNQFLLIEESENSWGMYNSQGERLGGDDYILDYLARHKKEKKNNGQYLFSNKTGLFQQRIYYGTPGSGKSWTIKRQYEMRKDGDKYVEDEEKKKRVFRTTFHPDTDYASFVGCYKPVKDEDDAKKIVYKFVPQAFINAYVAAWSDLENPYYLIIEEINRGNCAQIFGDLFQLLDRNKEGYSEYPIKADHDLNDYLVEHLPEDSEGIKDGKLCLPPNLSIIASMNTSDQSLFPMDSAFKRRWNWEYIPIDYENVESGEFTITIDGEPHNWHDFLKAVNNKIKKVTSSEDKQMGNFFIKGSVDEKEFCDKVMFYLWSEVGKDNYQTNDAIFKYFAEDDKLLEFSFNELYDQTRRTNLLKGFIRYIEEEE